jgi:hypothetical protein
MAFLGCDDGGDSLGDTVPPAPITDLVVGRPLGNSLTAAWSASGDDGEIGQATYHDLRYSKNPITNENWEDAVPYPDADRPFAAGIYQGCQVFGLEPSTLYYFAVRSADEVHNWSTISNVASGFTPGYSDSIAPSTITDLSVDSTSSFTITLSWTASGDDGMTGRASFYDARFSILPIVTEFDWGFSARLIGEPQPAFPGEHQSMTITGLVPNREFFFAVRAGDEIVNWSPISTQILAKTQPAELIPPSAITDLTVGTVTLSTAQISWTAPGDDGNVGRASRYDIRRYSLAITEETWANCSIVLGEPQPGPAGSPQSMTLSGLTPYRLYNLAIKSADEIPNWSPISNVVTFITDGGSGLIDTVPPARIVDIAVVAATQTALNLRWRVVGDDGNSGNAVFHDLRYSTDSITDASWETATIVDYVLPPRTVGTVMNMDVKNLAPGTVYYFAMKTGDESLNWSPLSLIARGETLP